MSHASASDPTRFHLSLNVSDLSRSVEFYKLLLGVPPAKQRDDYAKFELDDPPLVLSLEPHPTPAESANRTAAGTLNHAGFRLPDSAVLIGVQRRLEAAGIGTQREEGVECCYARQTKFWVHDPDRTLWEVYVLEGDIEHRGAGQSLEAMGIVPGPVPQDAAASRRPGQPVTLTHRLGQPFPEQLAAPADGADEVLLQGTFNASFSASERQHVLREVHRVLRPGGRVLVHVLTADRVLATRPRLPGPAAVVEHVPVDRELLGEMEAAGLAGVFLSKFGTSPCFQRDGVEMRETKIVARKPAVAEAAPLGTVVYKGPFREVSDETGRVFRRGERITVDGVTWEGLKAGPAAEQFLFLPLSTPTAGCAGQRRAGVAG